MMRKVKSTVPQGNGTLITYEDGSQEFLDGVTATLNRGESTGLDSHSDETQGDDEESLLDQLKRKS